MQNIKTYMTDHRDEDISVTLQVFYTGLVWIARIVSKDSGRILLDRQGNMYMNAEADTMEEALAELDVLAATPMG